MPIHLVCECGTRVIAPVKRAGQSIRCPKCDGRIAVPGGAGQEASSSSHPTRSGRMESAIADLVSARQADAPSPPKRMERVDPPQEKPRPSAPAPNLAPNLAPAVASNLAPMKVPSLPSVPAARLEAAPKFAPSIAPSFAPSIAPSFGPSAKIEVAPAIRTRPSGPMVTIPLDDLPEITSSAPVVEIDRPIRVVTTGRGGQIEKGWLGAAYGVSLLCGVLAIVGIGIAGAESWAYYRAEELWRMQRWALLVLTASTVQLALAVYLAQVADWIACRAAAVVISCIAAAEAMVLAVTLFSNRDGWFARFLDLAPHMRDNRAIGVTLLLTLLSVLLAYTSASVSLAWQRYEGRGVLKRGA